MKKSEAWTPPTYSKRLVFSLKALQTGTANDEQQKIALAWIINQAAATYDQSFRPESDRATAFAEGRRFVGLQIVKLLNLSGAMIEAIKD